MQWPFASVCISMQATCPVLCWLVKRPLFCISQSWVAHRHVRYSTTAMKTKGRVRRDCFVHHIHSKQIFAGHRASLPAGFGEYLRSFWAHSGRAGTDMILTGFHFSLCVAGVALGGICAAFVWGSGLGLVARLVAAVLSFRFCPHSRCPLLLILRASHTIFHTQLCHIQSFTHIFVMHNLVGHTGLGDTIFHTQLCKLQFCHNEYFTQNFVTHYLASVAHKQLCPSTTSYYKAYTKYFPVLLRTTTLAQSTSKRRSNLISCERVAPDLWKLQFYLSFWRSTSVSCEKVQIFKKNHN